jgi:hypothetical protein
MVGVDSSIHNSFSFSSQSFAIRDNNIYIQRQNLLVFFGDDDDMLYPNNHRKFLVYDITF